ncbi:MAG: DUF6308 family protein [Armatimonadota bacterium]|nr:DUF6308 family protein [Armatimonadota bacterium]
MTALRVQQFAISECEDRIEQNYYDWGRERDAKTWLSPDWDNASPDERQRIAQRGYGLYDGCPTSPGNRLSSTDLWVSVGFRSRVVEFDAVRFLARADVAEPLLASIPDGTTLDCATDEQIVAAAELIRLFAGAPQIGLGKATKVLHKKRPDFMPVLDSVVSDFLWKNFPHTLNQGSPLEDTLALYRTIFIMYHSLVEDVRNGVARRGFALTNLRVMDWILWLGWRQPFDPQDVEYGFGKSLRVVWEVSSVGEARSKARDMWEKTVGALPMRR